MIEKPVTKSDCGTQTDTHFYETNIVKSYEWNEWELRRKALKLVRRQQGGNTGKSPFAVLRAGDLGLFLQKTGNLSPVIQMWAFCHEDQLLFAHDTNAKPSYQWDKRSCEVLTSPKQMR